MFAQLGELSCSSSYFPSNSAKFVPIRWSSSSIVIFCSCLWELGTCARKGMKDSSLPLLGFKR